MRPGHGLRPIDKSPASQPSSARRPIMQGFHWAERSGCAAGAGGQHRRISMPCTRQGHCPLRGQRFISGLLSSIESSWGSKRACQGSGSHSHATVSWASPSSRATLHSVRLSPVCRQPSKLCPARTTHVLFAQCHERGDTSVLCNMPWYSRSCLYMFYWSGVWSRS